MWRLFGALLCGLFQGSGGLVVSRRVSRAVGGRCAGRAAEVSPHVSPHVGGGAAFPGGAAAVSTRTYDYDGWICSYRHRAGNPELAPLLLLHPVGIGLGAWFWDRLLEQDVGGREVFAPDFVGCGDSATWEPSQRGLFIPLDWCRQVEALWRLEIQRPCVVVAQGGLAPVGVKLATRQSDAWDGPRAVERLVLASPPAWREISQGYDSQSVAQNYDVLSSPLGLLAYNFLRRRAFVEFFSNLFLFCDKADPEWIELCCEAAARPSAQHPVFAFNAGVVGALGLYDELVELQTPTLILEGAGDKRSAERRGYVECMPDCAARTLEASLNVLPWEAPAIVAFAAAR